MCVCISSYIKYFVQNITSHGTSFRITYIVKPMFAQNSEERETKKNPLTAPDKPFDFNYIFKKQGNKHMD